MSEASTGDGSSGRPSSSRGRPALAGTSLRARVTGLATLAVALVLAVGGWLLSQALRGALVDDLAAAAALRSQDLAALAAAGTLPEPIPIGEADEAMVQVVHDGEVVAASGNAGDDLPALDVPAPPVGETVVEQRESLPVADPDDDDGFVVAATSVATGQGPTTVYVASSLEDVGEALEAAVEVGMVALPILVVVLAAGIWVLVGRTLSPVEAIRTEADEISGSDLHRRVPEPASEDEIGRLARTLNRMLGRLESSAERQRRFAADAAHELRTPVASIRTTLETARNSTRSINWDEVSGDVLADAIRMQQLTEQLLLLARVDAGRPHQRRRDVDLDDIVAQAVDRYHGIDEIDVETTSLQPIRVTGEPILLERVITNLLDNAVAHATARVEIALRQDQHNAVLTVDDDGPGIPPDQREAVFERFTRLDYARTRDQGEGAGLGLAIVDDIVQAHGGTVDVDDGHLGGARLQIQLPTHT